MKQREMLKMLLREGKENRLMMMTEKIYLKRDIFAEKDIIICFPVKLEDNKKYVGKQLSQLQKLL